MAMLNATSEQAVDALELVNSLQLRFVRALEAWGGAAFTETTWLRDDGRHGGGVRYSLSDSEMLGRASVNVSQVHYEDEADRNLGSATALSTIVHPIHPMHPSIHIHLSWTELKSGRGYWRIMADLNPSIPREAEQRQFADALQQAAPKQFADACEQGDRYFFIPALNRHRGVTHFYLENYQSGCFEDDRALASRVGEAAIDTYMDLLSSRAQNAPPLAEEDAQQLAYHTLYFFQVLTLDRGTTSGLLIHNQNDIGILGSLPPQVDKELLRSWIPKMPVPQNELLEQLIDALPGGKDCRVDDAVKQRLADVVRHHYGLYPEALDLQASGTYVPPTVNNHRPDQL